MPWWWSGICAERAAIVALRLVLLEPLSWGSLLGSPFARFQAGTMRLFDTVALAEHAPQSVRTWMEGIGVLMGSAGASAQSNAWRVGSEGRAAGS